MTLTDIFSSTIKSIIHFHTKHLTFNFSPEITFFLKFNVAACNISLALIVFLMTINLLTF